MIASSTTTISPVTSHSFCVSWLGMTLSKMRAVRIGSTSSSAAASAASATANRISLRCGRRKGVIQREAHPRFGLLLEALAVLDHRRVPRPPLEELGAREAAEARLGIGNPDVVLLDAVQHDPVVALPVDDRGQRQLVQAVLGGANRPRMETEILRRARDPVQRGSAGTRMRDLADVRERDGPPVGAADHAEARGAAVHLVELEDVREAPGRPPPRLRRRLVGEVLDLRRLRRHGLGAVDEPVGGGRLRGQDLVGEVERHPRKALEVVLHHPLLHPRPELGVLVEEPA